MSRYPKHLILINNGVKCTNCGCIDIMIPSDLDVVIQRIEEFVGEHCACTEHEKEQGE